MRLNSINKIDKHINFWKLELDLYDKINDNKQVNIILKRILYLLKLKNKKINNKNSYLNKLKNKIFNPFILVKNGELV